MESASIGTSGIGGFKTVKRLVTNRLGVATVVGGCYAIDITGSDGDSQTSSVPDPAKSFGNIIATAAGNLKLGLLCIADSAVADNQPLMVTTSGPCLALIDGTANITAGDPLMAVAASTALVTAAGSSSSMVGISGVTYATDAAALKPIVFNGEAMFHRTLAS